MYLYFLRRHTLEFVMRSICTCVLVKEVKRESAALIALSKASGALIASSKASKALVSLVKQVKLL